MPNLKKVIYNKNNGYFKVVENSNLETGLVSYSVMLDQVFISKGISEKDEAIGYIEYIFEKINSNYQNKNYLGFEDWKKDFRKIKKVKKINTIFNRQKELIEIGEIKIENDTLQNAINKEMPGTISVTNLNTGMTIGEKHFDKLLLGNKNLYKVLFSNRKWLTDLGIVGMDGYQDSELSYFSTDLLEFKKETNINNQLEFILNNGNNEDILIIIKK